MQQADKSMTPAYDTAAPDQSWLLELSICIAGFFVAFAGKLRLLLCSRQPNMHSLCVQLLCRIMLAYQC